MAFPSVVAVLTQQFSVAATSHDVDLPATVQAGDLLLIAWGHKDSGITASLTDWTELYDAGSVALSNNPRGAAYALVATGSEGGTAVDVVTSSATTAASHVYHIRSWGGTIATDIDVVTANIASGTTPDMPAVTAGWGSDDNLFITAAVGADDDETFTAAPTNYTNLQSTASGAGANAGCEIGSARRELAADTDNPGTFTLSAAEAVVGSTFVIKPAAGGGAAVSGRDLLLMGVGT